MEKNKKYKANPSYQTPELVKIFEFFLEQQSQQDIHRWGEGGESIKRDWKAEKVQKLSLTN